MFAETKFFWFLLVLNFPSSLLQALYQEASPVLSNDVVSASNTNILVLGDKYADNYEIDHTILNNLKAPEIIQQIDVKDAQNQVISNVNNVIINNESESLTPNVKSDINVKNNSIELQNVDNNATLSNTVIPKGNSTVTVDSVNTELLYIPQNGSILSNDTDTERSKADNFTVFGRKNASANESEEIKQRIDEKKEQIKVLNTINDVVSNGSNGWTENYPKLSIDYNWNLNNGSQDNITNNLLISNVIIPERNATIGAVNLVSLNNDSSIGNESAIKIVNQTYFIVPVDVGNSTQLLKNSSDVHYLPKNVVHVNNNATNSSKGIKNIRFNDDNNDTAWRSLIPSKRKKEGNVHDIINLEIQNVSLEFKSLKNIKVNENNVSVEGVNHKNDSTVFNIILNDEYTETATLNNKYTAVSYTKVPINIENSTTISKENISTISDIFLITNNSSILNNELEQNYTDLLKNYTSSINENDTYIDIAWRSDIPVRKNKSSVKDNIKSEYKNKTFVKNLQNRNILNLANVSDTTDEKLHSENNAGPNSNPNNIFMIVNSGNIEGFHANLPVVGINPSNNQTVDTDKIKKDNFKLNDSKLVNALINSTINKVVSNILDQNINSIMFKNIFLILNSGTISDFQLNSFISDVLTNGSLDIDKSVQFNDLKNIKNKSVALKHSKIESKNPILDIKFRNGVNKDTKSNKNTTYNFHTNNQSLKVNPVEIKDLQSNLTVRENLFDEKDISIPEEPAFRSLLPPKNKTAVRARTVLSTNSEIDINKNKDSVKPLPEPELNIGFDFNNLNLIGNAFDLIKRLKRSTNVNQKADPKYFWEDNKNAASNEISNDLIVNQNGKPCTDKKCLNNYLLYELLKISRSLDNSKNNNQSKSSEIAENSPLATEANDLECPLSVFVKLALQQLKDKFSNSKSPLISNIYPTISSLLDGKSDPINLATHLLWNQPFPIEVRLQLLYGDTSAFIAELNKYIDVALCKL